jgi:hypothetical protein
MGREIKSCQGLPRVVALKNQYHTTALTPFPSKDFIQAGLELGSSVAEAYALPLRHAAQTRNKDSMWKRFFLT